MSNSKDCSKSTNEITSGVAAPLFLSTPMTSHNMEADNCMKLILQDQENNSFLDDLASYEHSSSRVSTRYSMQNKSNVCSSQESSPVTNNEIAHMDLHTSSIKVHPIMQLFNVSFNIVFLFLPVKN